MAVPIKMQAAVAEIIQYAGDVYQITFIPGKKLPQFKAGQFLHLALDEYDPCDGLWPESRAFSIASSSKHDHITIVYRVKGSFTRRMKNELSSGRNVWLKFPYGSFIVNTQETSHDIVLVAGGIGIAPFVPYLEEELEQPSGRRLLLVYGIRGEHCFLFKNLLQTCCQCLSKFELVLFNAQVIDFVTLMNKAKLLNNPHYFISGPQIMIKSLRDFLFSQGVNGNQIHTDDWN
jgi:predicted ferric reductase